MQVEVESGKLDVEMIVFEGASKKRVVHSGQDNVGESVTKNRRVQGIMQMRYKLKKDQRYMVEIKGLGAEIDEIIGKCEFGKVHLSIQKLEDQNDSD
jgi:hypothetical protein